jgi:tetratricopeptide (TPR) repeat protein
MKSLAWIPFLFSALLPIVACSEKQDPQEHVRRGAAFLEQKKYQEAIVEFRTALQLDPKLADARLKLSDAYLGVGDGTKAVNEIVRAADLKPDDAKTQLLAGQWLLQAQQFEDASARADRVLAKDSKNAEALILKGNALAGLGDLNTALTNYEEALTSGPGNDGGYIGIGTVELARGRQSYAETAFQSAAKANPKSAAARLALANLYWSTGKMEAAEKELKAAHDLEPASPIVNRALGVLYMGTKRLPEAEPYLLAFANAEGSTIGKLTLANYYVTLKRNGDARRVLEGAAAAPDGYAEATARLAAIDVLEGKKDEARAKIEKVLSTSPKHINSLVLKARLLAQEQKYEPALAVLDSAQNAEPNAPGVYILAGTIYSTLNRLENAIGAYESVLRSNAKNAMQAFEANFRLGTIYLQSGSTDKAMTYAQSALQIQPRSANAHLLAARIETARGELNQARTRLMLLEKDFAKSAGVNLLRAQIELATKHPDMAAAAFRRALEIDPSNTEALVGLSRLDVAAGKRSDALARIEGALQRNPASAELHLLAGQLYVLANQQAKAERSWLAAIEHDPNRFEAYTLLGELYLRENRLPEAIKQFETVLARNPKSVSASTAIGVLLQIQGKQAEAEKAYERTLAMDSRAAVAANNLAWLLVDSNRDLDRALGLAQTARQQSPNDADVADTLGWIFVKKQMATSAIPGLESSAKLKSNDPVIHFHLGVAYRLAGKRIDARRSLGRALELSRDFPGSDEARKLMAALGG